MSFPLHLPLVVKIGVENGKYTYMGNFALQGQWLMPEFNENEPIFDDIEKLQMD